MAALSALSFGSYAFGPGWLIETVDSGNDIDEVKSLGTIGVFATPGLPAGKNVRIKGKIGGRIFGPTINGPIITQDDVRNELNGMLASLNSGYQYLSIQTGSGPQYVLICQKRKFSQAFFEGFGYWYAEVQIELFAPDPRLLSRTVKTWDPTMAPALINNVGSAITYPTITFAGAFTNPSVSITANGAPGAISLSTILAMGSTDNLVITCDPRARPSAMLLNGFQRLDIIGANGSVNNAGTADAFPILTPGPIAAIALPAIPTGGSIAVSWQDAIWL